MKATQVGVLRGILEPLEDEYDIIVLDTSDVSGFRRGLVGEVVL